VPPIRPAVEIEVFEITDWIWCLRTPLVQAYAVRERGGFNLIAKGALTRDAANPPGEDTRGRISGGARTPGLGLHARGQQDVRGETGHRSSGCGGER
jgi:hypothetical protein